MTHRGICELGQLLDYKIVIRMDKNNSRMMFMWLQ